MNPSECNGIFSGVFDSITRSVEFDPKWSNGAGWFDKAILPSIGPEVPPGHTAKSQTNAGRRLIFVGTVLGTIAVFDRYEPRPGKPTVFSIAAPMIIEQGGWYCDKVSLSEFELETLIGSVDGAHENLGRRLNNMYSVMRKLDPKK